MRVDNTQAITAMKRGYSKKLKSLQRCHRCALGVIHELITDDSQKVTVKWIESPKQKGDVFTKSQVPLKFREALTMIGFEKSVEKLWHSHPS